MQDQISAFIDDELSGEECAFLVRRLERDPDARAQLVRYSAIGAVLRGELVQMEPSVLRRRLQEQLNGADLSAKSPVLPRTARGGKWLRPALSAGIAASVAAVALFSLKMFNNVDVEQNATLAKEAVQGDGWSEPASYVVPREPTSHPVVAPPIRLTNYLINHSEYTSPLSRTSVHSNVVGAADPSAADANDSNGANNANSNANDTGTGFTAEDAAAAM